ncbi:hypothetical protein [Caenimonas aquaedulcis]|uniref:Uncharacterized protein n=1 Tax=Caenimonas aquaedulcis TaxID=2793270 RepID=A0A931MHV0_9BURK|nr:hypothetical protein [Caenimonas aquaedulcis]MBG9388550.1 hypothetical protein [Caenimonas aquaedulcis]
MPDPVHTSTFRRNAISFGSCLVAIAILVSDYWIPSNSYAGAWLRALPGPLADPVGGLFVLGVLPAALAYLPIAVVSERLQKTLLFGGSVAIASSILPPITALLRSQAPDTSPLNTLLEHSATNLFVSFLLMLFLCVFPNLTIHSITKQK